MKGSVMETYSGEMFDFEAPDPESIHLDDIAHALSLTCRFGGHIPNFYSVADHALMVRSLVIEAGHPELAKEALHHDSHEAILGDLPTPIKQKMGQAWKRLAASIDEAICQAFDLSGFNHEVIHKADELALRIEASHLKKSRGIRGAWCFRELPAYRPLILRDQYEAEQEFKRAHVNHWEYMVDQPVDLPQLEEEWRRESLASR